MRNPVWDFAYYQPTTLEYKPSFEKHAFQACHRITYALIQCGILVVFFKRTRSQTVVKMAKKSVKTKMKV